MRISEALSPTRDIVVSFTGASLNVTYRPVSYSVEALDALAAESTDEKRAKASRIIEMIQNMVVAWDLEGDDEVAIDVADTERLRKLPMNIFTAILQAVKKDQSEGEAERPSDAI